MVVGCTPNVATGFLATFNVKAPFAFPELVRILACPGRSPVTTPALSTVAMEGVSDVQVMGAFSCGSPREFLAVATSISEAPTTRDFGAVISTVAGAAGETMILAYPVLPLITAPTRISPG